MFCLNFPSPKIRTWGTQILRGQALEEIEGEKDGESGIAVVKGYGEDSVDAENSERKGEQQCGKPDTSSLPALCQRAEKDAPGEDRAKGSGDGGVKDVVEDDAAGELDDCSLNEECKRRVGEGEIAIRHLAERETEC